MASTINTNVASLTAQRNLSTSQASLNTSINRLSSGLRINTAKDDAAGLAISERFTSQIRGTNQAARNANDGISLSQVAEGALKASGDILQRVRELAVQSANATNSTSDRKALQQEVSQLVAELDRISLTTEFNGKKLLDGTFGTAQFQVGANANQTIIANTANMRAATYGNNQNAPVSGFGAQPVTNTLVDLKAPAAGTSYNGLVDGTIQISGSPASGSVEVKVPETAASIANKINGISDQTGVTATARTQVALMFGDVTGVNPPASGAFSLTLQSDNAPDALTIAFNLEATTSSDRLAPAVAAVNEQTAKTGITASLSTDGKQLILTNASGNDISVGTADNIENAETIDVFKLAADGKSYDGTGTVVLPVEPQVASTFIIPKGAPATPASLITSSGYLVLDSNLSFNVISGGTGGAGDALLAGASNLQRISDLDVTSFESATNALKTVDSALAFVSGERAKLGAMQARFETAINNLNITSENLSASRSRIMDADFAVETANLSRVQILQQAGTAMVAQANQIPQGVLSLLK